MTKGSVDNCILRRERRAISIMHIKYDVEILGIFRLSVCVMEMRSKEMLIGSALFVSPAAAASARGSS